MNLWGKLDWVSLAAKASQLAKSVATEVAVRNVIFWASLTNR
jgi:hypothetical protein